MFTSRAILIAVPELPRGDSKLIQIVSTAMAEAVRLGGDWIACRIGCTECCLGPFPISHLDAARLRAGLEQLAALDPVRAAAVTTRAADWMARHAQFDAENLEDFLESCSEDEPCPALDPATGGCDLYEHRPITCRTFGPAVRFGSDAVAACHLCFDGATDETITASAVTVDPEQLVAAAAEAFDAAHGLRGETLIAACLAQPLPPRATL